MDGSRTKAGALAGTARSSGAKAVITALRGDNGGLTGFGKFTRDLITPRHRPVPKPSSAAPMIWVAMNEPRKALTTALEETAGCATSPSARGGRYGSRTTSRHPCGALQTRTMIEENAGDRLTEDAVEHMRMLMGRVHRMKLPLTEFSPTRGRPACQPRRKTARLIRSVIDLLAPPEFKIIEGAKIVRPNNNEP